MGNHAEVNGIKWTCEAPEPGRRAAAPWVANVGPVRLTVRHVIGDEWRAEMDYPIGGRMGHLQRSGWPTVGEAMVGAERWARLTLEDWRDLGELARVALAAMEGQQ